MEGPSPFVAKSVLAHVLTYARNHTISDEEVSQRLQVSHQSHELSQAAAAASAAHQNVPASVHPPLANAHSA